MLVDLRITIDGEPLDEAWKKRAGAPAARDDQSDPASEGAVKATYASEDKEDPLIRSFVLRTSRSYVPDPRASSQVWTALDADSDGRLSAEELAGAADRLWLRDANDDRIIAAAELASLRDQLEGTQPGAVAGPSNAGPGVSAIGSD